MVIAQRTVAELVEDVQALTTEIQQLYCLDEIPWVVGYSGGKDSSCVLQLVWNAIAALPPSKRTKTIHVITTDTLVENPYVSLWVRNSLKQMKLATQEQNLPFEPHLLQRFIRDVIRDNGEAILVLGTRKAESTKRAYRMKQWEAKRVRDHL